MAIIFLIRLFYLQVIEHRFKLSADNIVLRQVRQYPPRGRIYDRSSQLMVYNEAAYDLMVIPGQVKNIDTLEFCKLLNIDIESFEKRMNKAKGYSYYKPSVFLKQISKIDFGIIYSRRFNY